jgi:hypothetical protein
MTGFTRRTVRRNAGRTALYGGAIAVSVSIALSGCGPSGAPAVASVQGVAISQGALAHRMDVENARLQGASTRIPVPDPPRYARCTAAADAAQARLKRHRPISKRLLGMRCARVYIQLREKALAFLVTAEWLQGEAAAQGISVSRSEVDASYRQLLDGPAGQTFASRLKQSDMTSTDELLQLRIEKLSLKLRAKLAAAPRRPLGAFVAAYRRRWRQRTTCRPEYLIAECSNGPPLPTVPAG